MEESEDDVKAALGKELAALGDDVVDYLAAAICDELVNHPPRAARAPLLAAIADVLYPFLLDAGVAEHEHEVTAACEALLHALRPTPASLVSPASPAPHPTETPKSNAGSLSADAGSFVPCVTPASSFVNPRAEQPTAGIAAGDNTNRAAAAAATASSAARVERPSDESTVAAALTMALEEAGTAELSSLDADLREYLVAVVCDDPNEREATLEEMLGPGLSELASDDQLAALCSAFRRRLDVAGAPFGSSATAAAAATSSSDRVDDDPGFRKLKTAVRMNAGEEEALSKHMDEVRLWGGLQADLLRQEKEAADRLAREMAKNQAAAEDKRLAKERKERERARRANEQAEATAAQLLAAEAAPQRRRVGDAAVDITVHEFTLPSPSGGADLLQSARLQLIHGRRYGLCGKNGAGKSTLLRLVALRRISGLPSNLHILYVAQDTADKIAVGVGSALEAVVASDKLRMYLLQRKQELEESTALDEDESSDNELNDVLEQLEHIGAATAHTRASAMLRGLQFSSEQMAGPVASLSGGWRMRVALAQALFQRPDVLLLDEPTNHLDLEAVMWLETCLRNWGDRTLVVVSHDRTFLNEVCTDVCHLHRQKLEYYQGDYNTFEAVRAEQRERQQKQFEIQEAKKKELQKFVDKHLHKGSSLVKDDASAKQAKAKAKQIARIGVLGTDGKRYKLSYDGPQQEAEAVEEDSVIRFHFPEPPKVHGGGVASLQLKDVHFSYADRAGVPGESIFRGVDMGIELTTRMGLMGANGAGKSTLVKLITGQLSPSSGEVVHPRHFKIGAFTQHHMDQLDLDMSPLEYLFEMAKETEPTITVDEVRRRIGQFRISGAFQTQRMELLSGGQKSRVAFCKATWHLPHLLLLDEPTNHLDIETVDALIDAVNAFKGGVIVVSHDQHFVQRTCSEMWVVDKARGSGLQRLDGSFEAYKKAVLKSSTVC